MHLPHARVVAIESEREFGLSVLQRLDDELRDRGECSAPPACRTSPGRIRPPSSREAIDCRASC